MKITVLNAKKYSKGPSANALAIILILWPFLLLSLVYLFALIVGFVFSTAPQPPQGFAEFIRILVNIAIFIAGIASIILGPFSVLAGIAILVIKRRLK